MIANASVNEIHAATSGSKSSRKTGSPSAPSAMPSAVIADLDRADEAHGVVHERQRGLRAAAAAVGELLARSRAARSRARTRRPRRTRSPARAPADPGSRARSSRGRGGVGVSGRSRGSQHRGDDTASGRWSRRMHGRTTRNAYVKRRQSRYAPRAHEHLDLPHEPRARPAVHRARSRASACARSRPRSGSPSAPPSGSSPSSSRPGTSRVSARAGATATRSTTASRCATRSSRATRSASCWRCSAARRSRSRGS